MNHKETEPCELAEVIYEKPLSGAFQEVPFGSELGNTLWVKFSDRNGINEWIGKFGDAGQGARRVMKISEPDSFFVSAGCFAYLIDATDRKLVNQFENRNGCEITFDIKRNVLIAASWTKLSWVDFGGKVLFSHEIAVDGIRDLKVEGNILSGLAFRDYQGEREEKFLFDLEGLKIIGWEKIPSKNSATKKPWWKFW